MEPTSASHCVFNASKSLNTISRHSMRSNTDCVPEFDLFTMWQNKVQISTLLNSPEAIKHQISTFIRSAHFLSHQVVVAIWDKSYFTAPVCRLSRKQVFLNALDNTVIWNRLIQCDDNVLSGLPFLIKLLKISLTKITKSKVRKRK